MRSERISTKTLLQVKPILESGERVKVLDFATTLNPWLRALVFLPPFILLIASLPKVVNLLVLISYLALAPIPLRKTARLIVFTDQRILVLQRVGGIGAKYTLLRVLPRGPEPVESFQGRWKRFDSLDQSFYIIKY